MTTLKEYLDSTKAEKDLKDLIMLIAAQADPIRGAFITNQKYVEIGRAHV
jgi:fructose-1,6-bisphosphatase I